MDDSALWAAGPKILQTNQTPWPTECVGYRLRRLYAML
jgi:hypothetical protein